MGIPRAYSQPPPSRPPALPSGRAESPVDRGSIPGDGPASPGAASNHSDHILGNPPPKAQAQPWKQKAIQVKSADYYLDLLKAARGHGGKSGKNKVGQSCDSPSGGGGAQAWSDGGAGYAEQMRLRASVVEATQRQEETAKYERGYAALQCVQ